MATIIRGLLAHNLDWQFVLVGVFLAVTVELCGVSPLSFAVGAYLPLSTTLPIWVGGAIKGVVDRRSGKTGAHGEDLGPGSLFSTGLVAGGALAAVRDIMSATSLPVLVDLDDGYGDAKNVTFAVRCMEGLRVSAVFIEDQEAPKKCGQNEDKKVIPVEAMVSKIRGAVAARSSPE